MYLSAQQRDSFPRVYQHKRSSPRTLAPISKIESIDFCVISESESNVVSSSLSVNTIYDLSRTCFFFPLLVSMN
jgi:hypothetical protein